MTWEKLGKFAVSLIFLLIVFVIMWWTFSTKEFKGYYMRTNSDYDARYQIRINWENSWDQVAFSTTNADECLRVFRELTE